MTSDSLSPPQRLCQRHTQLLPRPTVPCPPHSFPARWLLLGEARQVPSRVAEPPSAARRALDGFCSATTLAFAWPGTMPCRGRSRRRLQTSGAPQGRCSKTRSGLRRPTAPRSDLTAARSRTAGTARCSQEPPGGGWGWMKAAPRAGWGGPPGRTPSTATHCTRSAGAQRPGGSLRAPSPHEQCVPGSPA